MIYSCQKGNVEFIRTCRNPQEQSRVTVPCSTNTRRFLGRLYNGNERLSLYRTMSGEASATLAGVQIEPSMGWRVSGCLVPSIGRTMCPKGSPLSLSLGATAKSFIRPMAQKYSSSSYSEKAMSPHSSTLAWEIPWTEEPGRLQSMGLLGVGHGWATSLSLFTFMHWRRKWQPTPVFLPGASQGRGSLVGGCLCGCTESDMTEAT